MKKSKFKFFFFLFSLVLLIFLIGCGGSELPVYDPNVSVPPGDPPFPPGKQYGIVDPHHYLDQSIIDECLVIIDGLKRDGLAEIVVLIREGVKHPEDYATHYGRYIGLGEKGKNNGFVWLIRPDVKPEDNRMTYSVGRGLPRLTSSDLLEVMLKAALPINSGDFNTGILILVRETDQKIREIYKERR